MLSATRASQVTTRYLLPAYLLPAYSPAGEYAQVAAEGGPPQCRKKRGCNKSYSGAHQLVSTSFPLSL